MLKLNNRRRYLALALVAAALATAGLAAYFSTAQASGVQPSPVRPFATAGPSSVNLHNAVLNAAKQAGLSTSGLYETGATPADEPYRAAIIGSDASGATSVAFVTDHSGTTFAPVSSLLSKSPMVVDEDTGGTPLELREVGLIVVVRSPINQVEVTRADGTTTSLLLTGWPNGPYASASIVSTDSGSFPSKVVGYDASGKLIDEQNIDLNPVHP